MQEILDFVAQEPIYGTHDHQAGFASMNPENVSYRDFFGYADADFVAASGRSMQELLEDEDELFRLWEYVRTTGYGQATSLGAEFLFGMPLTKENAPALTKAMKDFCTGKSEQQAYEEIFAKANVVATVNDCFWGFPDFEDILGLSRYPEYFRHALRPDHYRALFLQNRAQIEEMEQNFDFSIQTLSDLDDLHDVIAERAMDTGKLVAIKVAIAYQRDLSFDNASFAEAERVFAALMQGKQVDRKPLHDYQFHRAVQRARDLDIALQVHTGHLAGNWQDVRQGDPYPFVPVFQQYKNVRFDVFHAGWPFSYLLGSVGKEFPNVWLDLCWAWAMSPIEMERVLDEWLANVPCNKIFLFGADTGNPFCEAGYAQQARKGLGRVLARKIERGEYDLGTAKFVARRLMHENPREFFAMGEGTA